MSRTIKLSDTNLCDQHLTYIKLAPKMSLYGTCITPLTLSYVPAHSTTAHSIVIHAYYY